MGIMSTMKKKFDRWDLGLLIGMLLPIIAFFVYWQWKHTDWSWERLYNYMQVSADHRNNLLVFPLVPNLILFYFSNFQLYWENFTQGLVGITIALAIPVVILLVV